MNLLLRVVLMYCLMAQCLTISRAYAGPDETIINLNESFHLGGKRSMATQYYEMQSELINYALDGKRSAYTVFRLILKAVPTKNGVDEYTCLRFTLQEGDAEPLEIPALRNWQHTFDRPGIDAHGQVFGIEHAQFEGLTDSKGNAIAPDKSYHIYNTFIDFHAFCDVFGQPADEGNGVQHLTRIGQKIIHAAANSEAPVHLGRGIKEGSVFQNGRITLELKGVSTAGNQSCALIEYDSGASSFNMIMNPMPDFEVTTVGSSHYFGDIYKNLQTNWIQKATMKEFVVSETTLPVPPNKINSVVERAIIILNRSEQQIMELID